MKTEPPQPFNWYAWTLGTKSTHAFGGDRRKQVTYKRTRTASDFSGVTLKSNAFKTGETEFQHKFPLQPNYLQSVRLELMYFQTYIQIYDVSNLCFLVSTPCLRRRLECVIPRNVYHRWRRDKPSRAGNAYRFLATQGELWVGGGSHGQYEAIGRSQDDSWAADLTSNLSRLEQAGTIWEGLLKKENWIEYLVAVYIGKEGDGNRREVWASISGEGLEN